MGCSGSLVLQTVSELRAGSGKGEGEDRRGEFLRVVADEVARTAGADAHIIIAGPGFTKDDLRKILAEHHADLSYRITMDEASSIGKSGFQEVLRRGAVSTVLEESRIAREAKLIEDLMREIATGGKAAYGFEEVKSAADFGAIESLLVLDTVARRREADDLMREVSNARGKVVVFSSEFEPGQRLESLGGIATILRFKIRGD